MAKKSAKHQSKPTNTSLPTAIATNITPLDNTSPTHVAFHEFIELADLNSIRIFITTASLSPEGENLKLLWARAYKEGLIAGHALYGKMEEKLKEVQDCAYKTGYDEGRHDEQEDWLIDGHGYCIQPLQHPREELSTQTDPPYSVNTSSQTEAIPLPPLHITTSVSTQTNPTTFAAMSQSLMLSENAKKHTDSLCSENLSKLTVFSSPTRSPTSLNSPAPSTTAPALETRQKTVEFTPRVEKVDFPPNSTNSTPKTPSSSILERTDDVTRDYASPETHNDIVLQPITPSTTASSLLTRVTPHLPVHQKSAQSRAVSKPQPYTESSVVTGVVTALKTRSTSAGFTESCQKTEKTLISNQDHPEMVVSNRNYYKSLVSHLVEPDKTILAHEIPATTSFFAQKHPKHPVFDQKHPKMPVSGRFDWADDAKELPITPTFPQYPPRDLSCLRSTSTHPFLSLQRKRGHRKSQWITQRRHNHWHSYPYPWHHSSPYTPFPQAASLNWDQDPRLRDLSNALRALGWARR